MSVPEPNVVSRALLDWWTSRRRARRALPSRADLDPIDLKAILPHLFLADVEPGPEFRYRVLGSFIIHTGGGPDATGRLLAEDTLGPDWRRIHGLYAETMRRRAPILTHERIASRSGDMAIEVLHTPLARDGDTVDMILGAFSSRDGPVRHSLVDTPTPRTESLLILDGAYALSVPED